MTLAIDAVPLDALEFDAETAEWLAERDPGNALRTVGDLATRFSPRTGEVPGEIVDSLSWAMGYYAWQVLRGETPP